MCPHCGGPQKYDPVEYTSFDAHGAQQSGRHAGTAFVSGDPLTGLAHLAFRAASLAFKEYRRQRPWKCQRCGRRSD